MADITVKSTETKTDSDGNILEQYTEEKTFKKDTEPDYIKIYTKMWFDFRDFPIKYKTLFIELVTRMSYCRAEDLDSSQIVYTIGPERKKIMEACGWKTEDPLIKGLAELCKCGAIKKVNRGCYQINPEFAGKGAWKYNKNEKQGGIKNLITKFNFAEQSMETTVFFKDSEDENQRDLPDEIIFTTPINDEGED